MIPNLSLMVAVIGSVFALYVIVRCSVIVESEAGGGTKFMAMLAAAAALASVIALWVLALQIVGAGVDVGNTLSPFGR